MPSKAERARLQLKARADRLERKRGRPTKADQMQRKRALLMAEAAKQTPLEYLLSAMRHPRSSPSRKERMAIAAAPYVHPKLSTNKALGADPNNPNEHPILHKFELELVPPKKDEDEDEGGNGGVAGA